MKQSEIIEALNAQRTIILDRESRLSSTDYIAYKIAEGKATKTDYKDKIALRQQWRNEIDAARAEIARLESLTPDPDSIPEPADGGFPAISDPADGGSPAISEPADGGSPAISAPVPSVAAPQQPSTPSEKA